MHADTEPAERQARLDRQPLRPDRARLMDEFWDVVDGSGVRDSDLCRGGARR